MTDPNGREDDQTAEAAKSSAQQGDPESDNAEGAQPETIHDDAASVAPGEAKPVIDWTRVLAYGILPGLALLLTLAVGFSKWQESSARTAQNAATESLAAAKESTIAILSYQPDTVEKSMVAARARLTAPYKEAYTKLTTDMVIPSARHDHVSVTATVPAAASVSATPRHAEAILFVNQAATIGANSPTTTASSIRVTLEKIGGRWLISGFDPI
jgi:Mce-associated membrane protein